MLFKYILVIPGNDSQAGAWLSVRENRVEREFKMTPPPLCTRAGSVMLKTFLIRHFVPETFRGGSCPAFFK